MVAHRLLSVPVKYVTLLHAIILNNAVMRTGDFPESIVF